VEVLVERAGVEEVVLNGTRLGATVAMRVAAQDPRVRQLALWDPVPDPNGNLQAVFRRARASMLAMGRASDAPPGQGPMTGAMTGDGPGGAFSGLMPGQTRLDAGGYVIGQGFLDELKTWSTREDVAAFHGRVLILQLIRGWSGAGGLRRALTQLDEAYRAAGAESQVAEVMDVHPAEWFKQPDYSPVFAATSAWLGEGAAVAR
jgi:pimeloyl-ACP methyl ester carboxylesterase